MDTEEKRKQEEIERDRWELYTLRKSEPELVSLKESPTMEDLRSIFTPAHEMGYVAIDEVHRLVMLKPRRVVDLYYRFEDIRDYELLEVNAQVTRGGLGSAVLGGVLLGGVGAIAGSVIGKNSKKMVENLFLRVDINDLEYPCVYVNFIESPVPITSGRYKRALEDAHNAVSRLGLILGKGANEEKAGNQYAPMNPYEEVKQLKELLDIGAITQDEFDKKKRMILDL